MSFLTVFSAVSSFFQATWSVTWKRRLLIASGFLACLAIGFSVGRFALPARVEVREVEKVVTKVETKIEWKERIVVEKQKAQTKVVYIDRVIEGGRTTEKVTETTTTKEDTHATKDKDKKQEDKVEQWREKLVTKIVTNQPRWRVGVDVGWSWPTPKVNIYGPLIVGVRVDYRIVAGFGVGVWANTSVAAGAGLSYSF